jgi:hypothetical protein
MYISHLFLARVSQASYAGYKELYDLGFNSVFQIANEVTGTTAYLCKHTLSRQAVLVFRGTDDLRDISVDLNFVKTKTPLNRNLHSGFLSAYTSIKASVDWHLSELVGYDLYITGHSLGAALAVVCRLQIKVVPKATVTFGQPRVVGTNGSENLSTLGVVRYVNKSDIVVSIPKVGYTHSGECMYISKSGRIIKNPSGLFMFLDSGWKIAHWWKDHKIFNYIGSLYIAK